MSLPSSRSRHARRRWFLAFMLAPALLVVLAGSVYPLIYTIITSTQDYNLAYSTVTHDFIGSANFTSVLTDSDFWHAFRVSVIFTVAALVLEFGVGFSIALLLNHEFWLRNVFRSMLLIPMTIAPVVVGLIWRWLYNADYGVVNFVVTSFGGQPQAWLVNSHLALGAAVVADVWEWTPFIMLISLAALQTVPSDILDAAKLDGANIWQELRFVILPTIRNILLIGLIFRLLDAFRTADLLFTLTGGGPGNITTSEPYNLYLQGFQFFRIGYTAAMSLILIAITTLIVSLLMKFTNFD